MNYSEFYKSVEASIPGYNDLVVLGLTSKELDYFANKATFDVFREYFKAFEINQLSKFGITTLVTSYTANTADSKGSIGNLYYSRFYTDDMYFTVEEYAVAGGVHTPVKPVTKDFIQANLKNPKRMPEEGVVFWSTTLFQSNKLTKEIITNKEYALDDISYSVVYIKTPNKFDFVEETTADLNDEILKNEVIPLMKDYVFKKYGPILNNLKQEPQNNDK